MVNSLLYYKRFPTLPLMPVLLHLWPFLPKDIGVGDVQILTERLGAQYGTGLLEGYRGSGPLKMNKP